MNRAELLEVLGISPQDDLSDTQLLNTVLENLVYRVDVHAPDGDGWGVASHLLSITTDALMSNGEYTPSVLNAVEKAKEGYMEVEVSVCTVLRDPASQGHSQKIYDALEKRALQRQRQFQLNADTSR